MESLIRDFHAGPKERTSVILKRMVLSGEDGNIDGAVEQLQNGLKLNEDDDEILRIIRYDFALAMFHAGQHKVAEEEAGRLSVEYFDVLGLTPDGVFAKNPREIWPSIRKSPTVEDDVRRLADTLDLYAHSMTAQGKRSGLARIHAHKFYVMANAWTSAIRLGQDFAEEALSYGDPEGARQFFEQSLLPVVREVKLLEHVAPVRGLYAVVLAYCGRSRQALAEVAQLRSFTLTDPEQQEGFRRQLDLVEQIVRGEVRLPSAPAPEIAPLPGLGAGTERRKVGRNEMCPCGSGKKYKRCCGR